MKTLSCFFLLLTLFSCASLSAGEKKHVVFLISDDLNCYLGSYGHPLAKTPNLDKLAARGTQFNRAYCQYPVCNASRASIFTGLRPDQTQVWDNWVHFRHTTSQVKTLPEWFKVNGYTSARVGKIYHYNVPKEIGMDCQDDPASWSLRVNPFGRDKKEEADIFTLRPGAYGATLSFMAQKGSDLEQTDGIGATASINILNQFGKNGDKPLFLAFGLYRPHTPYVAPQKYFDLYSLDDIEITQNVEEDWADIPTAALLSLHKDEIGLDDELKKKVVRSYLASISFMDAQVGRVIDAIEEAGLSDDTMIVMTSDHGYHMTEHGLWQKQSLFENSARVPLIIATPDQKMKGTKSDEIVELIDLYPTIVEWAGLEMPTEDGITRDGRSLLPILNDADAKSKGYAISQAYRTRATWKAKNILGREVGKDVFHGYSIRTATHRYNRWDEGREGEELYDHTKDPGELNNLAGQTDSAAVQKALAEQLVPFEKAHQMPAPYTRNEFFKK